MKNRMKLTEKDLSNGILKKRIKLTKKELAIGMWLYIKLRIYCGENFMAYSKFKYLNDHYMIGKWPNSCILCYKYHKYCSKCPLGSCSDHAKTLWSRVINCVYDAKTDTYDSPFTLEERLEACDKIIEAIQNDIPDNYNMWDRVIENIKFVFSLLKDRLRCNLNCRR